jgi:8-oxo-dGTP diphosphatase
MTMHPIDKLAWIYVKDRKILATRSYGKDAWYIPGGKRERGETDERERGETDEQALIREVKEELSVDLLPETIKYLNTFRAQAHGKPEGVFVQMTCYSAEHKGEPKPSAEIEEIQWLDSSADPALLSPVDVIIFQYLKEKNLIN